LQDFLINIYFLLSPCLEPTRFETRRRQQKLHIDLENCAFRWFVLYIYITLHCARNINRCLRFVMLYETKIFRCCTNTWVKFNYFHFFSMFSDTKVSSYFSNLMKYMYLKLTDTAMYRAKILVSLQRLIIGHILM